MRRREFITFIGAAAAWPNVLAAEQARRVWRIGFLSGSSPDASFNIVVPFSPV
jgi:hypothetical protein